MPYALSAFAAVVYIVATFALATDRRRLALVAVGIELVGVLVVGRRPALLLPEDYPDATVWSDFGAGYGYVPLVLPWSGCGGCCAGRATNRPDSDLESLIGP